MAADRHSSFGEFWPHYLREHSRPATRAVHVVGTWVALAVLAIGLVAGPWWFIPLGPAIGYACAWISHMLVERNRPATFTYPAWSLFGDLRLAWLSATGRLGPELRKHGL